MEHIQTFTNETSVHGVRFLKKKHKSRRFAWAIMLVLSTTICWYQIGVYSRQYLSFNVSTKVTYTSAQNVQFPAITIWNQNFLRRTVIGRRFESQMMLSKIYDLNVSQVLKSCDYRRHERDDVDEILDKSIKAILDAGATLNLAENMDKVLNLVQVSREMTFVRCWWKQLEINCTNSVLNTIIEDIFVFPSWSMNLAPSVVEFFVNQRHTGINFNNKNYNGNTSYKSSEDFGMKSGYQLLLNVNSEEYCLQRTNIWYGVGVHAIFHDPETMPSEKDGPQTVFLKPGFQYSVALKPNKFVRKTERIGKCLTNYPIYLVEAKNYSKKVCQLQCIYEIILKKCGCIIISVPALKKAFIDHFSLKPNDSNYCWDVNKEDCTKELGLQPLTRPIEKFCPQCLQPCAETMYEYDVTALALSEKSDNYGNGTDFEKNFILLNVYFGSKSVNVIEDVQKYTLQDLFVYIGSSLCLFLGISFVSAHEIVFYLILPIHKEIVKLISWHMKKKLRNKRRAVADITRNNPNSNQVSSDTRRTTTQRHQMRANTVFVLHSKHQQNSTLPKLYEQTTML